MSVSGSWYLAQVEPDLGKGTAYLGQFEPAISFAAKGVKVRCAEAHPSYGQGAPVARWQPLHI